jgi:hypothetical protein
MDFGARYTDIGDPAWPCVLFFHGAPLEAARVKPVHQRP